METMTNPKFLIWDKSLLVLLCLLLLLHYSGFVRPDLDEILLIFVSVIGTLPVVFSAIRSLKNKKLSVDLLASIALIASLLTKEWASAAFINLMLTSARIFGGYTEAKAKAAIKGLLKLRPARVKIKSGLPGQEESILEVPLSQVKVGDFIVVESGDRVPVDGNVSEGEASIDQSSLTGESIPVTKSKGDEVLSSTLVASGSIVMMAEKIGKDTALEKIIALVENSQNEKSSIRTASDRFATWYIVVTLVASLVIYVVFRDMYLLLSLLLVACADDIALAIPLAFLAAVGYAARRGVIIKGGGYLEQLSKVKTFILDKTGTITRGKMKVESLAVYNNYTESDLLRFAGMTEFFSEHPVAKTIANYLKEKKVEFEKPAVFNETPGKGISAVYKGKNLVAGKAEFMAESGVKLDDKEKSDIARIENDGYSATLIGFDGKLVGFISCADEVRPHVKDTISRMRDLGVENIVMLTGDNEKVAKRVAAEAGITDFHSDLLPEEKIAYVKKYLNKDSKVAMVGDGVNDAASLALSDVGIAMGAIGSDAAIEAADIALMRDDFKEIPEIMDLGRYTLKIARQDFWIWGIVNVAGLVLVLARIFGPEGASAYNFATDFLPLANSMRLFNLHLKLNK